MVTMKAFSTEGKDGKNMDCYTYPDAIGSQLAGRWLVFYVMILYGAYVSLKYELNDYMSREQTKR